MTNEKLQLTAAILNATKEIEIYEWLALIVPEYGTKPFNKRFESWLNQRAGERFGTEVYKNWGVNGEDKIYPKVTFYFKKADYQTTGITHYELSINYKGKTVQYEYDTKTSVLRDHNENEKLYSLPNAAEIVVWADRIVPNRREGIEKMQHNLKHLTGLAMQRDKLKQQIEDYNNKISYAIADSMRIKR